MTTARKVSTKLTRVARKRKIAIKVEPWVAIVFTTAAIALVPWTIYLAYSLPKRHIVPNWDITWVGLDIAIMVMFLTSAVLASLKSRWLIISVTIMSSFLLVDAWFDIQSSHSGRQLFESVALAILVEIPFALLGFRLAYKTMNRNIE